MAGMEETSSNDRVTIRGLRVADGPACDAVIRSLPYHFGHEEGARRARAGRGSAVFVAVRDDRVAADDPDDGSARTRAFYRSCGLLPAPELPPWDDPALLMVLPLGARCAERQGA